MDIPADYIAKKTRPKPNAPRNEREEIIGKFLERLNQSRAGTRFKPMTTGQLVKLFEKVPTKDLYPFYKTCENARNFGAMFWHCLKRKEA